MAVSIDSDLLYSSVQNREVKTGSDTLGKDDFLKILMVQLQNQDPMNPMEDKEFISQMATFSSLEQMTNMNSSIEKLLEIQTQSTLISYSEFVGKEVTWHKLDSQNEGEEPKIIEGKGIVKSVQFNGESVKFIMDDGTILEPANLSEVNQSSEEASFLQASSMIGKNITWEDNIELNGIVQSVTMKKGLISFVTEDGQTVRKDQIIKISKN